MNAFSKFNHIPWKYIIGMNLSLLVLAGTFLSLQPALESTDNRPKAKDTDPTPIMQPRIDPNNPPELITADPNWAKIGDAVLVQGKNLGTTPLGTIKVGPTIVPSENIIEWKADHIVFTVPEDTETGKIILDLNPAFGLNLSLSTQTNLEIRTTNK